MCRAPVPGGSVAALAGPLPAGAAAAEAEEQGEGVAWTGTVTLSEAAVVPLRVWCPLRADVGSWGSLVLRYQEYVWL